MTGARRTGASEELAVMRKVRSVLKRSSLGSGLGASFVRVFSSSRDARERDTVRRVLLGTPVERALATLAGERGSSGDILKFVVALARVSASEASKGAERLSSMFDRWTLQRERRVIERRVMAFRGTLVSAVSGVVVGMISSLAPVLSGFQLSLGAAAPTASGFSPYEGAIFLLPSTLGLGMFFSPQRPYVDALVSLAAFVCVVRLFGPLASFGLGP